MSAVDERALAQGCLPARVRQDAAQELATELAVRRRYGRPLGGALPVLLTAVARRLVDLPRPAAGRGALLGVARAYLDASTVAARWRERPTGQAASRARAAAWRRPA